MTPSAFREKLEAFRRGALQDRNLYLWLAGRDALRELLMDGEDVWTPVPQLLSNDESLLSKASISASIEAHLRSQLDEARTNGRILVLTEPGLLARYLRSLTFFYEYVGPLLVTIIIAEPVATSILARAIPGLRLNPKSVASYFQQRISLNQTVEEEFP